MKISFTYSKVTPESAESGDFSEHGWITPGMWEYPLQDDTGYHESVIDQARKGDFDITDLSEAISFAEAIISLPSDSSSSSKSIPTGSSSI